MVLWEANKISLCESVFRLYFQKKISREELIEKTGLKEPGFAQNALKTLGNAYERRDRTMLEYLIFILFVFDETVPDARGKDLPLFVDVLDELLIESWHNQHENIATLLERIASKKVWLSSSKRSIFGRPIFPGMTTVRLR